MTSAVWKWMIVKPLPRAAIPAVSGAVIGFLTNVLSAVVYRDGRVEWASLFSEKPFWVGIAILGVGIFYQYAVCDQDSRSNSVLEDSKEGLAQDITDLYVKKIRAGEIDELVEADRKLRKIFKSKP